MIPEEDCMSVYYQYYFSREGPVPPIVDQINQALGCNL
jgi:hypothetical protein